MAKKVAAAPAKRSKSFRTPPPATYATAMDKLRDEMAKSKDNYVRVVGEYMTEFLLAHPEAEGKLLDSGKSIKGSLEAVRKEAEKVKSGNMAVLDDKTVFGIVLGYFGIEDEPRTPPPATQAPPLSGEAFGETGEEATSSDPPQAAAHLPLKGKAFGDDGATFMPPMKGEVARSAGGVIPAPDPFDLDALLGVM